MPVAKNDLSLQTAYLFLCLKQSYLFFPKLPSISLCDVKISLSHFPSPTSTSSLSEMIRLCSSLLPPVLVLSSAAASAVTIHFPSVSSCSSSPPPHPKIPSAPASVRCFSSGKSGEDLKDRLEIIVCLLFILIWLTDLIGFSRWMPLCGNLGGGEALCNSWLQLIMDKYSEDQRYYHTLDHLQGM